MSLLKDMAIKQSLPICNYGTGTLYDVATGSYQGGFDNKWVLNGGLANILQAIQGKANLFKSAIMGGLVIKSMSHYPGSEAVVLDTENALIRDMTRLARFAPYADQKDLLSRITPLSGVEYDIATFHEFMVDLCKVKEKNKKDYIIETPFLDGQTGKSAKAWVPTYVILDSITEMRSANETEFLNKEGIDDGKARTLAMSDGLKKSMLLSSLRKMCERYGICVFMAAATGGTNDIGERIPKPKILQHGRMGEAPKRTGSNFTTLTGNLSQAMSASFLSMDSKHTESRYPLGPTLGKDLNEVSVLMQRGKTRPAGCNIPFVVSQEFGILDPVTNFHYCKTHGAFGMIEKGRNYYPHLSPKQRLTRQTLREVSDASYEIRRALEITAELCFIQNTWNVAPGSPLSIHPEQLFEKLTASKTKVSDILNTSGVWTYDKKPPREYMSTLDIVELIDKDK